MEKNIKDYLHFYMKQWCEVYDSKNGEMDGKWALDGAIYHSAMMDFLKVKLFLRPLSDMTEEDVKEWDDVNITHTPYCVELDSIDEFGEFTEIYPDGTIHSKSKDDGDTRPIGGGELFRLLLSKGFDLFGLIDAGLAIKK